MPGSKEERIDPRYSRLNLIQREKEADVSTKKAWIRQILLNVVTLIAIVSMLFAYRAWAVLTAEAIGTNALPGVISYQGYLVDAEGQPVTDSVDITFRLYTVDTGGAALWMEEHKEANAVPVANGLFNVLLGSLTPISSTVWGNNALYLGVQVGSDAEMTPREAVGMVPYALHAVRASGLSAADGDPADAVTVDSAGHVGIGTTSPKTELSVSGRVRGAYDASESEYTEIGHGGANGYINTVGDGNLDFRHDGADRMSLSDAGNLDVLGTITADGLTINGQLDANGTINADRLTIDGRQPFLYKDIHFEATEAAHHYSWRMDDLPEDSWVCGVFGVYAEGNLDEDYHGWGPFFVAEVVPDNGYWKLQVDFQNEAGGEKWWVKVLCVDRDLVDWGCLNYQCAGPDGSQCECTPW
jgi:hypothetical protein